MRQAICPKWIIVALGVVLANWPGQADARSRPAAQEAPRAAPVHPGQALTLEAGAGQVVMLGAPVSSVFAADPKVAEVRPASPTSLFVFGVAPGRTTVAALNAAGAPVAQWDVTVRVSTFGASEARAALARVMPGAGNIKVEQRANGGLAVSGDVVAAADADRVMQIVRGYAPSDQVIENRLTVLGALQVNLHVRVAEMSRNVTRQLGVNWQAIGSFAGRYGILGAVTRSVLTDVTNLPSQAIIGYNDGRTSVNAIIDALAQDQLVRVLAEPNLTAISGETASFLVGGEFPIPVAQQNGTISLEFKQYGVSLAFVPTVSSAGRISLRVRPEVSQLSDQGAVRLIAGNSSLMIPALTVRRAETTVELGSGQSFAIAGLLQDTLKETGSAVPGIGEVPVLGALFRSDSFQRNETELVIIVTPYVVRPASDPTRIAAPTTGWRPASDLERILLLRQGSADRTARAIPPRRIPGDAGFVIQ